MITVSDRGWRQLAACSMQTMNCSFPVSASGCPADWHGQTT